jgi:hypothetical protein
MAYTAETLDMPDTRTPEEIRQDIEATRRQIQSDLEVLQAQITSLEPVRDWFSANPERLAYLAGGLTLLLGGWWWRRARANDSLPERRLALARAIRNAEQDGLLDEEARKVIMGLLMAEGLRWLQNYLANKAAETEAELESTRAELRASSERVHSVVNQFNAEISSKAAEVAAQVSLAAERARLAAQQASEAAEQTRQHLDRLPAVTVVEPAPANLGQRRARLVDEASEVAEQTHEAANSLGGQMLDRLTAVAEQARHAMQDMAQQTKARIERATD